MTSDAGRAERKLATALFADLVGSTALGAAQDPERTRALLDRFYDAMADEIQRAGGTVEKFAGDAVMAAFGVPAAHEDHVERALHAALAMRRRLADHFGSALALRVGVNTGEVVVGRAREGSSFVTGDAVNVAARLEQAADPGEILVGERAAALVAGAFEFATPMRVEAKGKPDGVACRRLIRALSLMRPRGLPGLRNAFVGRDAELTELRRAYERTRATGRPQAVTVMGDAGVGKSRLSREFWAWCGAEAPEALRRTGRCPAYGPARTYRPLGEIVKEHFGLIDSDAPERALGALGERSILALAFGLDVARELHPIEARDRLHDAWIELVAEIAAEQPLVLLVEDVHWAEQPLVELLERTLREADAPVLLVATGRPEFLEQSPTWGRGRVPSTWIWLEPLGRDDVDRWLRDVVPAEAPPAARDVLDRAEGNPLFLEELLGTLIERGALREGAWAEPVASDDTSVPDTVQAVLAARIDLLPAAQKAALQAAAVVGRVFWPSAIRELTGGEEPDLNELEGRDFVRRRSGSSLEGEREYVFKHALTRDVAYGSLTRRERALKHAAFAAWLEHRGGGRDEDAPLLAEHYAEAVRPDDADLAWTDEPERYEEVRALAVRWLRRAAELAVGRYEIAEAVAQQRRAIALELEPSAKVELLWRLAHIQMLGYDVEGLRAAMEEALALGPRRDVAAEMYAQLAHYALGRRYVWKEPPPRELGEQWLERALELSEPGTKARAWALLASAMSDPSRVEEAAEARRLGVSLGEAGLAVVASEAQSLAATQAGRYQDACDRVDEALADAPRIADPGFRSHAYWNAAFVYARAGRMAGARRFAEDFDRLAAPISAHDRVHALGVQAALEGIAGAWPALAALTARAERAAEANQDFPCQFNWRTLVVCALAHLHLGDERESRRLEEGGRASAVVAGPPELEPALLRLALLEGDEDEVRRILEVLPGAGNPFDVDAAAARLDALLALRERERLEAEAAPFLAETSYTRPFALRALGLTRGQAALVDEAAAGFDAMGLAWRAAETRALGAAGLPRR